MHFSKGAIFKVVLPLVLTLGLFPGAGARAASATPPANSVELNTYGSLPVIVFNLTQAAVDITLSTNSSFYTSTVTPFPLVIGLPGIYYGGTTSALANIANSNAISQSNASLNPIGSLKNKNITFSDNYDWMSLFTLFPSWTAPGSYSNMQY